MTGFASGPDTVAGLLWAPVLLLIASQEGVCGSFGSVESGANGQSCTADSAWNETLWDASGGHHCLAHGGGLLRDAYYTHDTSLPGCAEALAAYRAATSPHYSCNCTGEHSYLGGEGGLRTGLEFQILSWVAFGLSALLAPLLGTVIDSIESKRIYCILVGCAGVGMLGSAVIAHNWVWVVGMSFAVVGATATELVVIPRQAYLDELSASFSSLKPGELNYLPGQVAGQRLIFSYLSQTGFVVVVLGLSFAVSTELSGVLAMLLCGVWYLTLYSYAVSLMNPRPPTRAALREGGSLCAATVRELAVAVRELPKYPEACKWLVAFALAQNGAATTVITISTSYLYTQLKFSTFDNSLLFLSILLCGMPWNALYAYWACKRFTHKQLWVFVMLVWVGINILVPAAFHRPDPMTKLLVIVVSGPLLSLGVAWYYCIYWPSFMELVPPDKVGLFGGLWTFVKLCSLLVEQPIYIAVLQATGNPRLGWATLVPWCVASLLVLLTVDWDKGRREAGRTTGGANPRLSGAHLVGGASVEMPDAT